MNAKKPGLDFNPSERSRARLAAVQALYEMDMVGAEADSVLREFMSERWDRHAADEGAGELNPPDKTFLIDLVKGVTANKGSLDEMIGASLGEEWTVERLEVLVRSILRAGVFELAERADVPPKVVINEYMDVAHAFFSGGEPKIVNGVLDKVAHKLREDGLADD